MLISQDPNISPDHVVRGEWEQVGEVEVPPQPGPKDNVQLVVGTYEKTMPEPAIVLDVNPDPNVPTDAFVADLHRLDEGDTYRLVYFFGNYGGPTYHVRAWQRAE